MKDLNVKTTELTNIGKIYKQKEVYDKLTEFLMLKEKENGRSNAKGKKKSAEADKEKNLRI